MRRLSATPQVFLPKGSPGTGRTSVAHSSAIFTPSPPPTQRPLSADTAPIVRGTRQGHSGEGLGAKTAVRPASARPRAARPWSGKKKPDPAHAGKAELEKRTQLPDSHPDKISVPPPPELEVQWALSAMDAPLLSSLITRYAGTVDARWAGREPTCACVWEEKSKATISQKSSTHDFIQ